MDDTEPDYPEYTFKRIDPPNHPLLIECCVCCDMIYPVDVLYIQRAEEAYDLYCDTCIEDFTDEEEFVIVQ